MYQTWPCTGNLWFALCWPQRYRNIWYSTWLTPKQKMLLFSPSHTERNARSRHNRSQLLCSLMSWPLTASRNMITHEWTSFSRVTPLTAGQGHCLVDLSARTLLGHCGTSWLDAFADINQWSLRQAQILASQVEGSCSNYCSRPQLLYMVTNIPGNNIWYMYKCTVN